MKVSIQKFKRDLKKYFAGNVCVSTWETITSCDKFSDEIVHVGLKSFELSTNDISKLPAEVDGVKIVYFYEGEVTLLQGLRSKHDPLIGGISMGAVDVTAGTYGGVVWSNKDNKPFLLTNEHVVSPSYNTHPDYPQKGHPIVQPGPLDGGSYPSFVAGYLYEVGGMKKAGLNNKSSDIDAALIKPEREYISNKVWKIGVVNTHLHTEVVSGDTIIKVGRTTGVTKNKVAATGVSANIGGLEWNNPMVMENLIVSESAFVKGGDSGSRVWKESTMEPIGLVFAGSSSSSFMIPAQTICDKFDIYFGKDCAEEPEIPEKEPCIVTKYYNYILDLIRRFHNDYKKDKV